jgi:hypothetical protein
MRLVNNSRYIQLGAGPDVGSPEWVEQQRKYHEENKPVVPVVPTAAKVGIGIGGLLLIGLGVWFFFFRKK